MAERCRTFRVGWFRASILSAAGLAAIGLLVFAGSGAAASAAAPTNVTQPSIYGTVVEGETIHAHHGDWSPNPDSYEYQWQRCKADGSDCSDVGNPSSSNDYKLDNDDVDKRVRVGVRATVGNDTSGWVYSDETDKVPAKAKLPFAGTKPTISGTAQDNQTLTATTGSWGGADPKTYVYTWQRCDSHGNKCSDITKGQSYRVTSHDVGHRLRVVVTATNSAGSVSASSDPTDVVKAAGTGPKNTAAPQISGTAQDNQTVSVNAGTWTGTAPISFSYEWEQCDTNGNNCQNISGATGSSYKVTSRDVGHRLRVAVTARNGAGSSTATTGATAVVIPAGPAGATKLANGTTSIPASTVSLPDRLTIDQVAFTPKTIGARNEQVVAKFRVVDANGYVVRDALVYAIGVPANRVSSPGETKTDESGWATLTYFTKKGLPLKNGSRLTFFVRARKQGEPILGGVSTRRLVSLAVHPA